MTTNIEYKEEPHVEFKIISDRSMLLVKSPQVEEPLVEISGYDLNIEFNMQHLNSIEDVEAAIAGIGDLFREIIMEKLLEYRKPLPDNDTI